jgi:aldose 1-epimerase
MTRLAGSGWTARIRPEHGASFVQLAHGGADVLVPVPDSEHAGRARGGGYWMAPFCNRIDAGRFHAAGREWQLPINRPQQQVAIHGFAREAPFQVEEHKPGHALFVQHLEVPETPWRCEIRFALGLGEAGAAIDFAIRHDGDAPCPYGFGWHPFFARPTATRLAFQATHLIDADERGLPMPVAASTGFDGDVSEILGMDAHFAGWDGTARLDLGGRRFTLRASGAWARNLHVFAPREHDFLCVEPVTHATDAINRPELGPYGPMTVLKPGESLSARLLIAAE